MINKRLNEISKADLDSLIASQVPESKTLDYKSSFPADRTELLEDIAALANTSGGDLVIGVVASDAIPSSLAPVVGAPDQQILGLENAVRDGIEPRIVGTEYWPVETSPGSYVYVTE